MTDERTRVSQVVSPILAGEGRADAAIVVLTGLALLPFVTGLPLALSPIAAALAAGIAYVKPKEAVSRAKKTGRHPEVVEGEHTFCTACGEHKRPKTGYLVYYAFGYEVARVERFSNNGICECDEVEEQTDSELIPDGYETSKEYAPT